MIKHVPRVNGQASYVECVHVMKTVSLMACVEVLNGVTNSKMAGTQSSSG